MKGAGPVHPAAQERAGVIAWMARNPVAANLLMVLLLVGGVGTALTMQKEVFPSFELDVVTVSVGYPGAAPAEVEQGIILPIEDAIRGVSGIKEITSEAREGGGRVTAELVTNVDRMQVFQDIDQAVNRIRTFPEEIDQPDVSLLARRQLVLNIVLYGQADRWTMRQIGERLRDRLLSDERITQVELQGGGEFVTHIEIPSDILREYGLTLSDVARLVEASSRDVAAGTIESSAGEILLRMTERKQWAQQIADLELLTSEDGSVVTLGQIARIEDGFEEGSYPSRFNQQLSSQVNIFRVGTESPLEIADAVQEIMRDVEQTLPPGVSWRIDSNAAEDFGERLSLLLKNGTLAILIVLGILALFLEMRLAFWVMMGMTISFVGGILFLPIAGVSINMVSLFAFLVALGIVVDDAIVVGENVYEYRQQGMDFMSAAIQGTRDIALPVTFSILTNIVAFIPLLFMPGEMGLFWWPLPAVVIIVLALSLLEALFILPAHLAHARQGGQKAGIGSVLHHGQQRFSKAFSHFVHTHYNRFLKACLRFRYVTLTAAVALLWVAWSYSTSSHMGMIPMPEVSADEIEAGIRLPVGVTPDQAAAVADAVTQATREMFDKHDLERVAEGIKTNVRGGSFIDVEIVMRPPDEHDMTAAELIELWRNEIGDIPGVYQMTFEAESGPGGWVKDISVDLSHDNVDVLERATRAFVERAESFTNAVDVSDNFNRGKKQIDFTLRPEGRALGLTPEWVGQQVRDAFYGSLALRQMRGTNEVEVRVKLPREERQSLAQLENLILRTPEGVEVPLLEVVDLTYGEAFTSINRRDGRRVVSISMNVEPKRTIGQLVQAFDAEVLPELRTDFPGLTWQFEGSTADMRDSMQNLAVSFALAMLAIYALLALAFGNYLQPLIVLLAIPFGAIGAVIGHMLLGYDLSLISLMGMIALAGVVVNDSLIMVDFANRKRRECSVFEAIHQAGMRRFRPIVLTTLTTAGGLIPIIAERSLQAQYLIPMAISLGFGIVFGTAIILLLVPCLYLILEDLKSFPARRTSSST